jgi:hypothetical protein
MRSILIPLLLAVGSAACLPADPIDQDPPQTPPEEEPPPGDDPPPPDSEPTARETFDATVKPLLAAQCSSCHTGTSDQFPNRFLGMSNSGYYDAVVNDRLITGDFDPAQARMLTMGVHASGAAPAWTAEQSGVIAAWLQEEAVVRGAARPDDPPPAINPFLAPRDATNAFKQWSSCMSVSSAEWLASEVHRWADANTNQGQCKSCHNAGTGGYWASDDEEEMFARNQEELFIRTFFAAAPVADGTYTIRVNDTKLCAKGQERANNTGTHPGFNCTSNDKMLWLIDFHASVQQKLLDTRTAGGLTGPCPAPPAFPIPLPFE